MSYIISGEEENYDIPLESIGKYSFNCIKNKPSNEVIMINGETGEEITFGKVLENSVKFATILKQLGVEKNDVIAIINENDTTYYPTMLGAFYNGVVFNPLNPAYYPGELKHALQLSKPKLVICNKTASKNLFEILPELDSVKEVITVGEDFDNSLKNLENLLDATTVDVNSFSPDEFDPAEQGAVILCSSGTTGLPKGVLLTHLNLRQAIGYLSHKDFMNVSNSTTIQVVPNFHIFGLVMQLVLAKSLKNVLFKKFVPTLFLQAIQKYKVDVLYVVPSLLLFLVKSALVENYDISSIEKIFVGAAPVGAELQEEAKVRFGKVSINEFFGATELSGAGTVQTRERNKPSSCGRLTPGMQAKVCCVDTNEPVGPNQLGELCFKGLQVMKEYVQNETETKNSVDEDGFYHSGDLGYYDDDHFMFIVDRIKELIKYKGFQVPPAELEALVITHPSVKDCGVVGIPETRAGEVPLAFVVKQPNAVVSEEEIVNFVAEKISAQKRLYGGVRFIDEIPRNPSGKILRRKLKEMIQL